MFAGTFFFFFFFFCFFFFLFFAGIFFFFFFRLGIVTLLNIKKNYYMYNNTIKLNRNKKYRKRKIKNKIRGI